jgi:hypothetical protein
MNMELEMPGGCWSKETGEGGERVATAHEDNLGECAVILQED